MSVCENLKLIRDCQSAERCKDEQPPLTDVHDYDHTRSSSPTRGPLPQNRKTKKLPFECRQARAYVECVECCAGLRLDICFVLFAMRNIGRKPWRMRDRKKRGISVSAVAVIECFSDKTHRRFYDAAAYTHHTGVTGD